MILCAAEDAGAAPAGRFVQPRTLSMRIVLWHGLMCGAAGTILAAMSGACWQLVPIVLGGAGSFDSLALAAVIALGTGIGGLHRRQPVAGLRAAPAPAARAVHGRRADAEDANAAAVSAAAPPRHGLPLGSMSPPLCRLMRRSARSLRGRPIFETLHPEDFGIVDRALRQAQATGQPQIVACRFLVPLELSFGAFARTTFRSDTQLLPPLDPASIRHVRVAIRARLDGDSSRLRLPLYGCRPAHRAATAGAAGPARRS